MVPVAIRPSCANMQLSHDVLSMFPSVESVGRHSASLHRVLRGEFPCVSGTIKALRLPAAHPAALCCLRLAVPRMHSFDSLLGGRVRRRSLELTNLCSSREVAEETTVARKFPENPNDPFAHVPATPAGLLAPDHCGAAMLPLVCEQQRLPRKVFRRSIDNRWLSNLRSTLRGAGYPTPRKTRVRPLVGRYLMGFPPARFR